MKKAIFILSVFLLGLCLGWVGRGQRLSVGRDTSAPQVARAGAGKQQLEYANLLLSKGLKQKAAEAMAEYLRQADMDKKQAAKLCLRIGDIYLDLYKYEDALAYFYRAEMLDSSLAGGPLGDKIVSALERLGMSRQAQYELKARTAITDEQKTGAEDALARIGEDKITAADIDKAIERLPEWARKGFADEQGRKQFIRQYVAAEAIYRKARRIGIEKEPQIREQIELFGKDLVIREFLSRQIAEEISIDEDDIRNYYQAHKDRYLPKQDNSGKKAEGDKEGQKGKQKKKRKKGKTAKKQKSEEKDKVKDEEDNFNKVKQRVQQELRAEKEQRLIQEITKQALEDEDVEIY